MILTLMMVAIELHDITVLKQYCDYTKQSLTIVSLYKCAIILTHLFARNYNNSASRPVPVQCHNVEQTVK